MINKLRKSESRGELKPNPQLTQAAQAHANWLAQRGGALSHSGNNGSSPADRARKVGYSQNSFVTENATLGATNAQAAYRSWLNSPGHKANMLFFPAKDSGLGIASSADGRTYWVHKIGGNLSGVNFGSGKDGAFAKYNAWRSYYATASKKKGLATSLDASPELDKVAEQFAQQHLQNIANSVPSNVDLAKHLTEPTTRKLPKQTAHFVVNGGTIAIGFGGGKEAEKLQYDREAYLIEGTHVGVAFREFETQGFKDSYAVLVFGKIKP